MEVTMKGVLSGGVAWAWHGVAWWAVGPPPNDLREMSCGVWKMTPPNPKSIISTRK